MKASLSTLALLATLSLATTMSAQIPSSEIEQFTAGRDERLQRLNEAKFGLFIHWGPYAVPAGEWNGQRTTGLGEWIMYNLKIPRADYQAMARAFNPTAFNADDWARLAADAGVRYVVITAKHCDGFAMYDSDVTPYNIVDWTPFRRDVCRELQEACGRQGVELGFYYSHWWDWNEEHAISGPDNGGRYHDNDWDFADRAAKQSDLYINGKALPQVEELVTRYDPFVIWFDVPTGISQEQSFKFLKLVRSHNPEIIINNRIGNEMGDYATPEQYIPAGSSTFEACMTLNDTWGYKAFDHNWKSAETVVRNLIDIAHKGGCYLLNVGPTAEGIIPAASVRILQDVGKWMKLNGESIYGTTASPLGPLPFNGRCTAKPGELFIHLFDWPEGGEVAIPGIRNRISKASLLADPDARPLPVTQENHDVIIGLDAIHLPAGAMNEYATVLALEYEGALDVVAGPTLVHPSQQAHFTPDTATLSGGNLKYAFHNVWGKNQHKERGYQIDDWDALDATMHWPIRSIQPGRYDVYIRYGAGEGAEGNTFALHMGDKVLEATVQRTDDWFTTDEFVLGTVELGVTANMPLTVRPTHLAGSSLMNLKSVRLVPLR